MHFRRHERRPAAVRAIVLYPMNALVNDQLTRLRRILARGDSPDWQRDNLDGNVIHFGMYTGLTKRAGFPEDGWRREDFDKYMGARKRIRRCSEGIYATPAAGSGPTARRCCVAGTCRQRSGYPRDQLLDA